jgi:hypothetical protein
LDLLAQGLEVEIEDAESSDTQDTLCKASARN